MDVGNFFYPGHKKAYQDIDLAKNESWKLRQFVSLISWEEENEHKTSIGMFVSVSGDKRDGKKYSFCVA